MNYHSFALYTLVLDHLHPAEDEEKIDLMGDDIDHDHLAVAHQDRDQGQDILVEAQEDIPLPLGQGNDFDNQRHTVYL